MHGRQVRLLGFIVHSPDGSTYLARLAIACCAADATPLKVRLDGRDGLAGLLQDAYGAHRMCCGPHLWRPVANANTHECRWRRLSSGCGNS